MFRSRSRSRDLSNWFEAKLRSEEHPLAKLLRIRGAPMNLDRKIMGKIHDFM